MKKILLILLNFAFLATYAQAEFPESVQLTNPISITAPFVNVQETNGVVNKINKSDLIDVFEFASAVNLPVTGVNGKIYVTLDNNRLYRWNGVIYQDLGYVDISNKVDKVAGKSLILDTEITRLASVSNVDISGKEDKSNKNTANGYAGLGSDGKLISSQLPSITISDTYVTASQAGMLGLTLAETGDVAIRTDLNKSFILKGSNPATLGDWQELLTPTSAVTTVFGRAGAIQATVGDYTADQITETATRVFQTPIQKTNNDATSSIQTQLNGKQATLTNPVTGTGTTNYLSKFTSAGVLGNSIIFNDGTKVGIGTITPAYELDVVGEIKGSELLSIGGTTAMRVVASAGTSYLQSYDTIGNVPRNMMISNWHGGNIPMLNIRADVTTISGDVGVGTTTPSEKLEVVGSVKANAFTKSSSPTTNILLAGGGDITQEALPVSTATQTALNLKANLASPTFTGVPLAPTATVGANTTQVATTAFVLANAQSIPQLENNATDLTVWNNGKGNQQTNLSFGEFALRACTTSGGNTAIGSSALRVNTSGSNNTAVGNNALISSTTFDGLTAVGNQALSSNIGYYSTAVGDASLSSNTNGWRNTAVGYRSGNFYETNLAVTRADGSTFIGSETSPLGNNETNQIVIGQGATGAGSNTATLGNASITKTVLRGTVETNGSIFRPSTTLGAQNNPVWMPLTTYGNRSSYAGVYGGNEYQFSNETILKFVINGATTANTPLDALILNEKGATFSGKIKAFYPFYASDAAADADATLLSGQCYKLTGSRAVYQKP